MDDISFVTKGGTDLLKVHHKKINFDKVIEWDNYLTTEFIEGIDVMTEEFKDYRLDPLTLK